MTAAVLELAVALAGIALAGLAGRRLISRYQRREIRRRYGHKEDR